MVIFRFKSYNPIFSALEKYLRTRNYVITFKHVSHFTDLWKRRAIGPGKHHIHDVRSEGFYIGLHINLKFSFFWYFSNTTGWLLQERKTFNSIVNLTYFRVKTLGMTERMKAMVNMMATIRMIRERTKRMMMMVKSSTRRKMRSKRKWNWLTMVVFTLGC